MDLRRYWMNFTETNKERTFNSYYFIFNEDNRVSGRNTWGPFSVKGV